MLQQRVPASEALGMAHNVCSEAEPSLWRGQVFVRPGFAVFSGESGHVEPHRHWAHQVTLGCGEPVTLACDGQERTAPGFFVRAGVEHCLVPGHVVSVYLDAGVAGAFNVTGPEGPPGRQIEALTDVACSAWRERAPAALRNKDATLLRRSPQCHDDTTSSTARAMQVHAAIRGALSECSAIGLADLAAEHGLSTSRFSHWFSESTGLPFRSYKKWVRLVVAMEELANGADLTRAAHSAGFADSAHLSRTFRLAFGLVSLGLGPARVARAASGPVVEARD